VAVDALLISALTGTGANIKTALASAGITTVTDDSLAVTVSDAISVADANIINNDTASGVVTATISDGLIATLVGLSGTGNAYTVTVTDAATIAQLTALAGKTTETISYAGITDTNAHLLADAATNLGAGTYVVATHNVTVTDATVSIADLTTIDTLADTVTYNALSDTATNLDADASGGGTYVVSGHNVTVTDAATIAELTAIDALADTVTYTAITDDVTAMVTNTGSYVTSPTVATFQFATTTAAQAITGFTLGSDKIDLNALTDDSTSTAAAAGGLTLTTGKVYYLVGGTNDADSPSTSATLLSTKFITAATAGDIAYAVVVDNNSTSIYQITEASPADNVIASTELILMGTVNAVLTTSDLLFA
jgi:hypothetical protein